MYILVCIKEIQVLQTASKILRRYWQISAFDIFNGEQKEKKLYKMEDEKVREEETTRKVMYTVNDTRQEVEQIQYKNYIVRVCDYLDDIPTHEMGDEIKYLDEDIRNLQLENTILEGFLKEHEPGLLAGKCI